MIDTVLTFVAALGSGLVGGVFFAFSSFVMPALDRLPPGEAMAAMRSINVFAPKPPLMLAMMGTALVDVAAAVFSVVRWQGSGSWLVLAGCLVYLAGIIGMTAAFHVPRNNALDRGEIDAAAERRWREYYDAWHPGNHVRSLAGIVASGLFVLALVLR
ncbi:DUF1772 domain-containing protein [Amycolatopsis minnesotensis]|uniref:DUF1772 domain-containing protein n=1 Tax=Amycolatopsis minnesotensis TaxID=337894 RepID=A0ABP5DEX5_9PSEU